ncbi:MAG: sensor histidine kinase [Solirubrobacteraceae bacterium]
MPRSLRARLTLALAMAVVLVVAVTGIVVYNQTGSQLRAQIDRSIATSARQLAIAVTADSDTNPAEALATARRYATSQPYSSNGELLFVLVPGFGVASNQPELYGVNPAGDEDTPAERRFELREARRLTTPRLGYASLPAPDSGLLRVFEVRLQAPGYSIYAGAGETLSQVSHAEDVVAHSFVLAGLLALGLSIVAAYLIGTRISAPLRRSAATAARIDAGDLSPRIELPSDSSTEVQVLAEALNHMLDRLSDAFEAQREFVADASHELRTPLTVLRGQLDLLASEDGEQQPPRAELERVERLMQAEVSRLSRLVDDLLLLAQSDRNDFLRREPVRLDELATELWDGLSLIAQRRFETGVLEPVTVYADPDRLAQALRNLARNAITHTSAPDGLVRIDVVRSSAQRVRVTVSDDGPGIPPAARERVFERFYRIDKARSRAAGGAGLGLAIVKAITEAHGGRVRVGTAPTGGAQFVIELPTG